MPFSFKEKTTYNIIIKDSIIKDIYGKYNKELKEIITTKSQKDYGNLILNVKNKINKKLIIQLVEDNADQKVIYETLSNNTQVLNIENINPSIIKIKIIKDLNNNGKWDNGDLNSNQQPEEVFYYNQPITIKAYWDIELTIDIEEIINN